MKIGIVGVGMVGGTLRYAFRRLGHDVVCHDVKMDTRLEDLLDTEIIFICVPTAQLPDERCDTSIVEEIVRDLERITYRGTVVIKSTVVPGTTDRLHIERKLALTYCPEFLREKCSYSDFVENHEVLIVGSYRHTDFEKIRLAHGYYPKKIVRMTPMEAEFCKYFSNVYNALRINFACQFYDVCKSAGVDYSNVKNAMALRSSIGHHYLDCSEHFRGFGGSCLPKDTAAFARYVEDLGVDAPMFRRIVEENAGERSWTSGPEPNAKSVSGATVLSMSGSATRRS